MPIDPTRTDEEVILPFIQGWMPATLPIAVQIQTGTARHIHINGCSHFVGILVAEERLTQIGTDLLAESEDTAWMCLEGEGIRVWVALSGAYLSGGYLDLRQTLTHRSPHSCGECAFPSIFVLKKEPGGCYTVVDARPR